MAIRPPQPLRFSVQASAAGLALSAVIAAAQPASALTEYLGGGSLVVSDSCAEYGWTGTHQTLIRIQPQGENGNPEDDTQIALMMNTGTMALRVNLDHGIRHEYSLTQAVYIWNGPYSPDEPSMTVAFHLNADWPLRAGAEIERFNMILFDFNEHEGCVARLRGSLARN
jgi:hypothetical protein